VIVSNPLLLTYISTRIERVHENFAVIDRDASVPRRGPEIMSVHTPRQPTTHGLTTSEGEEGMSLQIFVAFTGDRLLADPISFTSYVPDLRTA
jgi:hypothetical protein